jgi:hypothetical protein
VAKGPASLQIAMRTGPRSAIPTLDLSLSLAPEKPKKPEGEAAADAAPAAGTPLAIELKDVALAREQIGSVPPDAAKVLKNLKGSKLRCVVDPEGGCREPSAELGKGAEHELERILRGAAESLAMMTVPVPAQPVGEGAFWGVETRDTASSIDVVTFRLVRVVKIDADKATLSIDLHQYAVSAQIELPGLPPGAAMQQLDASGQGEVDVARGQAIPLRGKLVLRLNASLHSPQTPKQAMMLQTETSSLLVRRP